MAKWTKEMIEEGIQEEKLGRSRGPPRENWKMDSAIGGMGSGQQVQQEGSKDMESGREGARKQYPGTKGVWEYLEDKHLCILHFAKGQENHLVCPR